MNGKPMNKRSINLIILLPIIIILSFSFKPKADNDSIQQQISTKLNEEIKLDELIVISADNDKKTFVYLDTNLRNIHLFEFVGKTMGYDSSFNYDVWDTDESDESDGEKFEWMYHEPNGGSTSLIWAISETDGVVTVKGKSPEQEQVKLENGLHVYFIQNKTKIDLPLDVELEYNK